MCLQEMIRQYLCMEPLLLTEEIRVRVGHYRERCIMLSHDKKVGGDYVNICNVREYIAKWF